LTPSPHAVLQTLRISLPTEPTVLSNGKRIPSLKPDHPRQLALIQALVRFSHIAAASTFITKELHVHAAASMPRLDR
jgi:hypothetical protein